MNFTILPQKKKRIKAVSQAANELCYKVFLVDEDVAVLIAAFAFRYNAEDFIEYMSTISKAAYTIVYEPFNGAKEPVDRSLTVFNLLSSVLGKSKLQHEPEIEEETL